MARGEAGGRQGSSAGILAALGPAEYGQSRPGQRVRIIASAVEQQRDARVAVADIDAQAAEDTARQIGTGAGTINVQTLSGDVRISKA